MSQSQIGKHNFKEKIVPKWDLSTISSYKTLKRKYKKFQNKPIYLIGLTLKKQFNPQINKGKKEKNLQKFCQKAMIKEIMTLGFLFTMQVLKDKI